MKEFLNSFIESNFPCLKFKVFAYQGKQELEKNIVSKLRVLTHSYKDNVKFVILRDADGPNCIQIKKNLANLANEAGRSDAIIRIVCQALESWYFGDLKTVDLIHGTKHYNNRKKAKFRDPDEITHTREEFTKICPDYSQVLHAEKYGKQIKIEDNTSKSFKVFVSTLEQLSGKKISSIQSTPKNLLEFGGLE
ncbi:MAG: DUF4276 family protein [Candidatus Symbiobacter sp.]|nr:DUF4276 family protein [Candidatus Symbiobacter sp.]